MSFVVNRHLNRSRSASFAPGNIRRLPIAINSIVSLGAGVCLLLVEVFIPVLKALQPIVEPLVVPSEKCAR
jgi:hypothetical protein